MILKTVDAYALFYSINEIKEALPTKVSYALSKNKATLIKELTIVDDLKKDCFDESGNIINSGKLQDIQELEIDIDLKEILLDDIATAKLPISTIDGLIPIIKEV